MPQDPDASVALPTKFARSVVYTFALLGFLCLAGVVAAGARMLRVRMG